MRLIGQLPDEAQATAFRNLASSRGMDCLVEQRDDKQWDIWAFSEDDLKTAAALLRDFQKDPSKLEYSDASTTAGRRLPRQWRGAEHEEEDRRTIVTGREMFHGRSLNSVPITLGLIAISVLVMVSSFLGLENSLVPRLMISEYIVPVDRLNFGMSLPEITSGQVWRLVTPIFVHFGLMHILFNMMWLMDLGSMIEDKKGGWLLLLLVAAIGVLSNIGQFIVSGPGFGGMSGVVYGLLGYIWMHAKFDPWSGLHVSKQTVIMMIIWFFVCLTGRVGDIANTVHGIGLVVGVVWGYIAAQWGKRQRTA